MPIQFGMPTLIELPGLAENLALCTELGLDFVELNMNLPEYQVGAIDVPAVKGLLDQAGKYLTIHLDENLNVCDFNPAVADAYLNTVMQTIRLAKSLEMPIINMHMADGVYFTLPDRKIYLFEQYRAQYLDRLRYFRDLCEREIGDAALLICVENCGMFHGFQQAGIDLLLESTCFGLTYDFGHDFCVGGANEGFILSRSDRLRHIHLHDARGNQNHLPFGEGEVDITQKLTMAERHNCRCVLETKTVVGLRKSARFIHERCPSTEAPASSISVTNSSTNEEKIALFLSLFRGREDIYARRWESKDGQKSGYSPVCRNEWERGVCGKPKTKCRDCPYRQFVPFDRQTAARHLAGKEVSGVYPILPDETCLFLAIDFDGDGWKRDVSAVRAVCLRHQIPAAVERSRSGQGAHMWFFFDKPVPAALARRLGSAILTAAMDACHALKFASYDRLFPNQDFMPKGGFGNLIALPLQRKARENGNSVFVDEHFTPYPDQWAFLSGLGRLSLQEATRFAATLCAGGELGSLYRSDEEDSANAPWQKKPPESALNAFDFPSTLRLIEANLIYIAKDGISQKALNRLKRLAAFKNPEFYKAQVMRLPTWDKPRIISVSDETEQYLGLPRGCKDDIAALLDRLNVSAEWQDERVMGRAIDVQFSGALYPQQSEALEKLLTADNGILCATTAFGKTVVAAALIAARKVNTLVLVNRRPLLEQWKTRLSEFLIINEPLPEPAKKRGRKKERSLIGLLGGGKDTIGGMVDIAVIQSLVRGGEVKELVKNYGLVIVDECHHIPAVSFERVLKEVGAAYVYGLTATPKRQDGHQPILYMLCGPIRYRDDAKAQAERRPFGHFVIPRFTPFRVPCEKDKPALPIQELYTELLRSESRNDMIVSDVLETVSQGRNPLVLTERKPHVEAIAGALREKLPNVITLIGGQSAKARRETMAQIDAVPPGQPLVIVATGKYVGEGFDVPRLDTLFLAMPIAWQGTIAQYAGRLHRLFDGKPEVQIYDYVDHRVPVLDRMYAKRVRAYASIGYKVKCDGRLPETGSLIYDAESFLSVFAADILAAKREVVIVSPYITKSRIVKMLPLFGGAVASGAAVTIVTRPAGEYAEKDRARVTQLIQLLREHHITVMERPKIHSRMAVIDSRIAWYGSINLLSFGGAEESMMRLDSRGIAGELLGVIGGS